MNTEIIADNLSNAGLELGLPLDLGREDRIMRADEMLLRF
jgi:hypothetical protein